ncbi:DUF6603 domain-containing protein [Mucilaginibacter sp.]|uniref:DUF6603 domain-containing protein n=1 Tax=Mucilaginibacter sp. TaxID=1882438 RepID=UPI003566A21D
MKINEISEEFGKKLNAHMVGYIGGIIPGVLDAEYTGDNGVFKLEIADTTFLNAKGSLTAYIFKDGDDAVFLLIPKVEDKKFSEYFPQMVPKSPWLSEPLKLGFPNLPAIKVTSIKWYYMYATGDDSIKKLWTKIGTTIADDGLLAKLLAVSREDESVNGTDGWRGGLFYTGELPNIPESGMIPEFAKSAWAFIKDKVVAQGCIYRTPLLPNLNLHIPILNAQKPFDDEAIEAIELSIVFSSPLMAVKQVQPAANDKKKQATKQKRELGLAGALVFKNKKELRITGHWALDDDAFFIKVDCALDDLTSYLDKSGLVEEVKIAKLEAGVTFKISKSEKSLESITFDAGISNLPIIDKILTIDNASLTSTILHPGKINMVSAKFGGTVRLGSGKVQLKCNGQYPKGEYNLYLDPAPEKQVYLTDIVNIFDSSTGFESNKAITKLAGKYDSGNKQFSLEMTIADGARLNMDTDAAAPVGFVLNNLNVGIYGKGNYIFKLNANFSYFINSGRELNFVGSAEYDKGWRLAAGYKGAVKLKEIIDSFKLGIAPTELNAVEFKRLDFVYDKHNDTKINIKGFAGDISVTIYGQTVDMLLKVQKINSTTYFSGEFSTKIENNLTWFNVEFIKTTEGYKLGLQLIFVVAGVKVYLQATRDKTGTGKDALANNLFSGGTSGLSVSLNDLLEEYFPKTPFGSLLPEGFLPELILNDIYVSYDGATKQTDIIGIASVAGKDIRIFIQRTFDTNKNAIYVFGIDTEVDCLDQLPLVGEELKEVSFSNVGFVYATAAGDYLLPLLSVPEEEGEMPAIEFPEEATQYGIGITLGGSINLPTQDEPIVITLPVTPQTEQYLLLGADNVYALTEGPKSFNPAVKWLNVNKKMGPLALNKLGFKFEGGRLSLLISGAVSLANLSVSVEGLGLSFSPSRLIHGQYIEPQFNLDGLGLALKKEPLEISGMLLRAPNQKGEALSFYGGAQISTSGFSIKGIGAYATLDDKSTSLFIYGLYNGPIGGPSFFFVTGIAAGFGYNRTIRIPKLEEVKNFPLVSMALSPPKEQKSLTAILTDLITNQWIPSSPGDYWLALGIKFTSFNIIESFVLVTAKFGNKLEFAIMGLSLLKWPSKGTPIVYIELALLAKFGPDSDVIAVTGMLTNNSYILNKNCKLTGGFAFYTWISGKNEGDFVITMGGYRAGYDKPAHYPTVDRLALNWKFSDELSITGEMYFALTPKEIMAGGKWDIAFNLSFLSARVIIWADMMVKWAPFEYYMSAGIIVRIEANIKVLFIHIHFKLQMGCVVQIWGPPFGGEIYVDWSIFSFTIGFGGGAPKELKPLVWNAVGQNSDTAGFQESFVPKKDGAPCFIDARIVSGIVNQTDVPMEQATTSAGLGATGEKAPDKTYVNGYDIVIAIDSFFPLVAVNTPDVKTNKRLKAGEEPVFKELSGDTLMEVAGADVPQTLKDSNKSIGIKPMAVTKLEAKMRVWVKRGDEVITKNITVIGSAKGVNDALWGKKNVDGPDVIPNALTGVKLHAVEEFDPLMIGLALDGRYEIKDPAKTLYGLVRKKPETLVDDRAKEIRNILRGNPGAQQVNMLKSIGFNLQTPDEIIFDNDLYNTPDYLASIGQELPANIM